MDGELTRALERLREAFGRYPVRPVLEGCPHCRGAVTVAEHDLFSLTIGLGNTIGTEDDLKSLLPLLLERLVTGYELDASVVFGSVGRGWRTWPASERAAIDDYLVATWRCLLAGYPSPVGAFVDAATFLDAAGLLHEEPSRFLDIWDGTAGGPADRHLAELVVGWPWPERSPVTSWLLRPAVVDRLYRAFVRDNETPWADDLALAHDYLELIRHARY